MFSKKTFAALLILFGVALASGIGISLAINDSTNSQTRGKENSDGNSAPADYVGGTIDVIGEWYYRTEVETVNNHSGYYTEWRCKGPLDKPIIYGLGYNGFDLGFGGPASARQAFKWYEEQVKFMNEQGYDIIVIDYYDGDGDMRYNAENLADFINYLDDRMEIEGYIDGNGDGHPDYELAYLGFSMGGVIPRIMFAQQNEGMGIDIYVSIDAPHQGIDLSNLIDPIAETLFDLGVSWSFVDTPAGRQLTTGREAYNELFSWLTSVETTEFKNRVIGPMDSLAVALSNAENPWTVSDWDLLFHTKYSGACSYVPLVSGCYALRTDFVPYHSAINADNPTVLRCGNTFWYEDTTTTFFDETIINDPSAHVYIFYLDEPCPHVHGVGQAFNYVLNHWESPTENPL